MYRENFDECIEYFTDTMGEVSDGDGELIIYKKQATGEYGENGYSLQEYTRLKDAIVLYTSGHSVLDKEGLQNKTTSLSLRTSMGGLNNMFFKYKNSNGIKRLYKIIHGRDINGRVDGLAFYHYDCIEG